MALSYFPRETGLKEDRLAAFKYLKGFNREQNALLFALEGESK